MDKDKLKLCQFCGMQPSWHIGGENDDLLFFGCGGVNPCVFWTRPFAPSRPSSYETALSLFKMRWNRRQPGIYESENKPLTLDKLRQMGGDP